MSKKDKNKFRKRIKAQILQEMSQTQAREQKPVAPAQTISPISQPSKAVANPTQTLPTVPVKTTISKTPTEHLDYVKKDLKKSAIIIGSIIIVIVGLSIADSKTNILVKAGNEVFKVLHISTQ